MKWSIVKMYRKCLYDIWQETPIEDAEYICYFIRVEDPELSEARGEECSNVFYFKLGEHFQTYSSKEHPYFTRMK